MNEEIRPLRHQDLRGVVDIHLRAFPGFFLGFLGPAFLREFYRSFLEDEAGLAFVSVDEHGRLLGSVIGPLSPDGYFKRLLKRRWWAFFAASGRALLKRPTIAPRLFRAVFYRGESPSGPPRSLLSSIAVAPDAQGRGIGAGLVKRFLDEVRARGGRGCFLTTDADANDAVNGFYKRLGWRLESSYDTREGRRMNRYVFDFSDPKPIPQTHAQKRT